MRFASGQLFDRYVIESLLGTGGMGEVYQAEDTRLGRKVALKVLRAASLSDTESFRQAVGRMQREARAVALFSHPSIVAIYDVGEHEGTPYIAMELVQGKLLRHIGQDVPIATRIRILQDVALALSAAHQAGIVHRDIKPENIMVRDDASVKVLDFGIARFDMKNTDPMAPTLDGSFLTNTAEGAVVGTPAYMSPEQLRGEEIDGRADQFAWGVVAFELLTGKPPFQMEKGAIGTIASILSDPVPPMPPLPDNVEDVIRRALSKAPEDRFVSMAALAAALSGTSPSEIPLKTPPSRRPKAATKTGNAVVLSPEPAPRRRLGRLLLLLVPMLVAFLVVSLRFFLSKDESKPEPASMPLASSHSSPEVVPTAVTALPIPESPSAEAKIAFREGLQAIRDATWDNAAIAFDRARKADPGMAQAHFRYAMLGMFTDFSAAQEAFRRAALQRSALSERDQVFLDAFAPIIQSSPSDYAAAQRKFAVLARRYPGDAEIVFWNLRTYLRMGENAGSLDAAIKLADQCVGLDPKYADCWQTKGTALRALDRHDEALVALDQCIEVSAGASDCLEDKMEIDADLGRCSSVLETARQWMAKEPQSPKPYENLAAALYYAGEPEASVEVAVEQAMKRYEAVGQPFAAAQLSSLRDLAFGHFSSAMKTMDVMARQAVAPLPSARVELFSVRVAALLEVGQKEEALRIIDAFFAERAMFSSMPERGGMVDPSLFFHAAQLSAGKLSEADYGSARETWLSAQPKTSKSDMLLSWRDAYALPTFAEGPASIAITTEPILAPIPTSGARYEAPSFAALRGYVRSAAGQFAEAVPYLEKTLSYCGTFSSAMVQTKQLAALGIAKEAIGDKQGACDAYRRVLARWGKAKDSLTTKAITKRSKAMLCEGGIVPEGKTEPQRHQGKR